MNIYCYKNTKVPFYLPPFFDNCPKEALVKELSRACILNKAEYQKNHFDEMELYLLGEYDTDHGEIRLLQEKEFLCDFSPLFKE